jgi:hypothetical protein
MKKCTICGKIFDPDSAAQTPAGEAGEFMAREIWGDAGELCPACLASRGILGMMYCSEFNS